MGLRKILFWLPPLAGVKIRYISTSSTLSSTTQQYISEGQEVQGRSVPSYVRAGQGYIQEVKGDVPLVPDYRLLRAESRALLTRFHMTVTSAWASTVTVLPSLRLWSSTVRNSQPTATEYTTEKQQTGNS